VLLLTPLQLLIQLLSSALAPVPRPLPQHDRYWPKSACRRVQMNDECKPIFPLFLPVPNLDFPGTLLTLK
jgi:hypothetical protein